jgi:hypothetical protein
MQLNITQAAISPSASFIYMSSQTRAILRSRLDMTARGRTYRKIRTFRLTVEVKDGTHGLALTRRTVARNAGVSEHQ